MTNSVFFNKDKTNELVFDLKPLTQKPISFKRAQKLSKRLGCTVNGDRCSFIFWNPEFKEAVSATLELFISSQYLNFDKPEQHSTFQYRTFPLHVEGEFGTAVIDGAPVGSKDSFGALYQVNIQDQSGSLKKVRDPLAASMPYGIFAPSEIYDINGLLENRADSEYFLKLAEELITGNDRRVQPSVNLLEIHVQTATHRGTLHSLKERFSQIAYKIKNEIELNPDEVNLTGFDAVELMPLDPVIQRTGHQQFWDPINTPRQDGDETTVRLKRPSTLNWGYDTTLFGSAAVNPSLLSSGRPDELLALIETLHNFPSPVKVVLDVVYGHADNAALKVLPEIYFTGPNMYGQDIRFRHPMVRAIILEMQRRKMNFGFEGVELVVEVVLPLDVQQLLLI